MKTNYLYVYFKDKKVGTLAKTPTNKIAFEYSDEWLEEGFPISPFSLPLEKKVFIPSKSHFHGLYGVFADSLPDAWGNLLLNRMLRKQGVDPSKLNPLDRLAIVGKSGMGALTYRPANELPFSHEPVELDKLAKECQKILSAKASDDLDELYRLGGTSGGARPKIMTTIDDKNWIIKFPAHVDGKNASIMEYEYSLCAKKCGIEMPETKLFPSKVCDGYFGIERFDIKENNRIHMLTVAAILELNFEEPNMDYHDLMKLTKILTFDHKGNVENMFRRMCFNVFAHNRDDHSKNFTYIYDEKKDIWRLSPAYDLTYSNTYYGEHTISINGEGTEPSQKDMLNVGLRAGISKSKCQHIMEEVETMVQENLRKYL